MRVRDIALINEKNINSEIEYDNYLYLDTGNLTKNIIDNFQEFDNKNGLPSRAKRLVVDGDILISTVRPIQCHYGYLENTEPNWLVSTGFTVITPIKNKVNGKYLYYLLTTNKVTNYFQMLAESSVSSYPSITSDVIGNFEINLPPISDQNKIVESIEKFDKKYESNLDIISNIEEYSQLLFHKWFVDFNFPNRDGKPYKDSGGEMIEVEGKMIPKGCEKGKFKDILKVESGKRPDIINEVKSDGCTIPVYGASKIMGFTDKENFNEPIIITGRVGTHGVLMRENKACWSSDNTLVIKSPKREFVYQLLKKLDFSKLNIGSTQPLITQTDLKRQKCILPIDTVVDEFEGVICHLMDKVDALKEENALLEETRDLMIKKLIL